MHTKPIARFLAVCVIFLPAWEAIANTVSDRNGTTDAKNYTTSIGNPLILSAGAGYSFTLAGELSGPGAVTKTGAGVVILSGSGGNTYQGVTTVNAGTLAITGGINSTAGVVVDAGATLLLNSAVQAGNIIGTGTMVPQAGTSAAAGSYGSTTFTAAGGTLALAAGQPGNFQTFGSMTVSADSTLDFSNGAGTPNTGATLFVGGMDAGTVAALKSGGLTLTIQNWSGPLNAPGAATDAGAFGDGQDRFVIGSGDLFGVGEIIPGVIFSGLGEGEEVRLGDEYEIVPVPAPLFEAVPEPGTAIFGFALCGVGVLRRRRDV